MHTSSSPSTKHSYVTRTLFSMLIFLGASQAHAFEIGNLLGSKSTLSASVSIDSHSAGGDATGLSIAYSKKLSRNLWAEIDLDFGTEVSGTSQFDNTTLSNPQFDTYDFADTLSWQGISLKRFFINRGNTSVYAKAGIRRWAFTYHQWNNLIDSTEQDYSYNTPTGIDLYYGIGADYKIRNTALIYAQYLIKPTNLDDDLADNFSGEGSFNLGVRWFPGNSNGTKKKKVDSRMPRIHSYEPDFTATPQTIAPTPTPKIITPSPIQSAPTVAVTPVVTKPVVTAPVQAPAKEVANDEPQSAFEFFTRRKAKTQPTVISPTQGLPETTYSAPTYTKVAPRPTTPTVVPSSKTTTMAAKATPVTAPVATPAPVATSYSNTKSVPKARKSSRSKNMKNMGFVGCQEKYKHLFLECSE